MAERVLWCLVDPTDWEEVYTLDPLTKSAIPSLRAGDQVEMEFLLELGQARTFGASVRAMREGDEGLSIPLIEPLADGLPYCHFRGRILEIDVSAPFVNVSNMYDGLSRFLALVDCGLSVTLEGLTHEKDPLARAKGLWIEGISTLWGNPARPWPVSRRAKVTLAEVRELAPARVEGRRRTFRIVAVRS